MTVPSSTRPVPQVLLNVLDTCANIKADAEKAVATLSAGPVSSDYIFRLLDHLRDAMVALNTWKSVTGLDARATGDCPGYLGTLSTEITTTVNAAQTCIDWVVTNFPKDNTAVFILSHQLNADGTRTPRSFSSAATAGLRTQLNALVATIG